MKKIIPNIIKSACSLLGKKNGRASEIENSKNPEVPNIKPLKNLLVLLGGVKVRVQSGINSAAGVTCKDENTSSNDLAFK